MVMPGVDGAAAQFSGHPWPPDRLGVAVDVEVARPRAAGIGLSLPGPALLLAAVPLGGLILIAVASGIL